MSATTQRDLATSAATKDFGKALVLARLISSPWFRGQALAWVARFAPKSEVVTVAEEAIYAALSADDPYQIVGASAWPLRALIERGHEQKIADWLPKLIEISASIANPVSRLHALYLLWQGTYPANSHETNLVLQSLTSACLSANSWQAGATLREVVLIMARDNAAEANRVAGAMPAGAYKRQALRRLAEGHRGDVRSFFWHEDNAPFPV